MPVLSKAQVAADFLLRTSARLGLPVPEYAKDVVNFTKDTPISDDRRVQVELQALIEGQSQSVREELFAERPLLALWYELYTQYDGDIQCAELTSHMDRPARKLRAEHAAKKAAMVTTE